MGIARGTIAGGVAILWHNKLDLVINVIRTEVDCCIAVQLKINHREFVILNVCTPYECQQNEDVYSNRLAFINSFIYDNHSRNDVVGDPTVDFSDRCSLFA